MKSGWLKGRKGSVKGSVEGWFPVDFVMPVLSESGDSRSRANDVSHDTADHNHVVDSLYSNLPQPQYVTHISTCVVCYHWIVMCRL